MASLSAEGIVNVLRGMDATLEEIKVYIKRTKPSHDAALLQQKLHSTRVQLALKRRHCIRLAAEKKALVNYIRELEKFNNLPTNNNLP